MYVIVVIKLEMDYICLKLDYGHKEHVAFMESKKHLR